MVVSSNKSIDVLLFDLGGVLVELSGVPPMLEWLKHSVSTEELWERWLLSPAVRTFERGHGTAAAFADSMILEFGLSVTAEEFIAEFTYWPRGVYPGVIPLLESLRGSCTLACFSNNNELHWGRICDDMGLGKYFDVRFSSHLIGHLKPDKEAFEFVVEALGCAHERILFLDDNRLNIEGALAVGMQARRTNGFSEVLRVLEEFGMVIPPGVGT
ncbi:MAG: HAD family hydrolase [Chloroflexota bacterium]